MKRKAFAAVAVILVLAGLTMLIAPRISNRVGEQIAHSAIEDFKALKSKATSDEPTEKKESSEDSVSMTNEKETTPDTPQTGDSSMTGFFIGLGALALGGLVACLILFLKKKKDDGDDE